MDLTAALIYFLTFLLAYFTSVLNSIANSVGLTTPRYAIVHKSYEMGTIITAYTFQTPFIGNKYTLLDSVNTGLDSYPLFEKLNSKKFKKGVDSFVKKAEEIVPEKYRDSAIIIFRFESDKFKNDILKELKAGYRSKGFPIKNENFGFLYPRDEAYYLWLATAYLADLSVEQAKNTLATLELTHLFLHGAFFAQLEEYHTEEKQLVKKPKNMFTFSNSNAGFSNGTNTILTKYSSSDKPPNNVCINPLKKFTLIQKDQFIEIKGAKVPGFSNSVSFDACSLIIRDYIWSQNMVKIPDVDDKLIYVYQEFFEIADRYNLGKEGVMKVGDYKEMAKRQCATPPTSDGIGNCLELIYTWSLLTHGLNLKDDTVLHVKLPYINVNASYWSLGDALNSIMEERKVFDF